MEQKTKGEMTMKRRLLTGLAVGVTVLGWVVMAEANLIKNASFEIVPNTNTGQGILPTDWVNIPPPTPTADTYSNDGSYGLLPSANGNFTGVAAYDGIRWVAGWSAEGQESFGQWLDVPLIIGTSYDMSGWLHQAVRSDLNYSGGYEIFLTNTPGVQAEYLGFLGPTTSVSAGWEQYSFSFTATAAMTGLNFLEFAPIVTAGSGSAYPGLDMVSLTATSVPEPATVLLMSAGLGVVGLARARRKKN